MLEELIPLVKDYEASESLDLWNSGPYAILFSIDTLLDSIKDSLARISQQSIIPEQPRVFERFTISEEPSIPEEFNRFSGTNISIALGNLRLGSFFPELTEGVARSMARTGRCGSLVHRLGFTSTKLYHLMSLPSGQGIKDHSLCGKTSCDYLNVDRMTYQPQHTSDCIMCDELCIIESELASLIQKDEVPIIKSTMNPNGNVIISVEKMTKGVEYIAISHVWAGGLGNFTGNQLPQCQLQAIHEEVGHTMVSRFNRVLPNCPVVRS
ncbi:hypothetical protein F4777DRAFT_43843 [Nemania sp. FL0916]|nr:hypothetical protein F4777DRAFT_43843 [Nemania sp. FL0916]